MTPLRAALAIVSSIFIASAVARPYIDGDLYWQRWLGELVLQTQTLPHQLGAEAFAAVGAPWVPQEWLFSVAVALSYGYGVPALLWMLVGAAAIGTLALVAHRIEKTNAPPVSQALAITVCAIAMLPSFGVRAQILGWCCFAGLLVALDARRLMIAAATVVTIIWANLHASAAVAPVVAALDALALAIARRRIDGEVGERIVLVPLLGAALCATPLGIELPRYAYGLMRSPIRTQITEWHRIGFGDNGLYVVLAVVVCAVLAWRRYAQRPCDALRIGAFAAASIFAVRNVPLLAIAAAPIVALALGPFEVRLRARLRRDSATQPRGAVALVALATVLVGVASYVVLREKPMWRPPLAAVAALAARGGAHHLYCEDFSWCSIALFYPNLGVFLDGRADPFPLGVWRESASIRLLDGDLDTRLARSRIDAIIATPGGRLDGALSADRQWRRYFADGTFHAYAAVARARR